jgi:MoxR-like ATPase
MGALDRLRHIQEELSHVFLERGEVIAGALAALLAGHHVLLVGPPGTAKSMLADELCRRLAGARYFQWLLTKFTTPEEVFGAISLRALEHDEYLRVTTHKLPEAHVAFLDEVFKANSSILNALLTVMNERRFHNGRDVSVVPLISLFGATNELPEDDDLRALFDRFLLRYVVNYIDDDFRFLRMLQHRPIVERTTLSLEDLHRLQGEVPAVHVPQHLLGALADVRRELGRQQIIASDRRYRQAVDLLRAHALVQDRRTVTEDDLVLLQHVLWHEPGQRERVHAVIRRVLYGYVDQARELLFQSQELHDYASRDWENTDLRSRAIVEAHTKLRHILAKITALVDEARTAGRPVDQVEAMKQRIEALQQQMLEAL